MILYGLELSYAITLPWGGTVIDVFDKDAVPPFSPVIFSPGIKAWTLPSAEGISVNLIDFIRELSSTKSKTLPLAKLVSPTITSPDVSPSTKVPVFALMVSVPVPLIISPTV